MTEQTGREMTATLDAVCYQERLGTATAAASTVLNGSHAEIAVPEAAHDEAEWLFDEADISIGDIPPPTDEPHYHVLVFGEIFVDLNTDVVISNDLYDEQERETTFLGKIE